VRHRRIVWALVGVILCSGSDALAAEAEAEAGSLHDLIGVLRERGVIDETDYEEIAARNAAYEARQKQERMPALSFWGDFRFRSEHLWFEEDETEREER